MVLKFNLYWRNERYRRWGGHDANGLDSVSGALFHDLVLLLFNPTKSLLQSGPRFPREMRAWAQDQTMNLMPPSRAFSPSKDRADF